jgi:hypothetical protein
MRAKGMNRQMTLMGKKMQQEYEGTTDTSANMMQIGS